MENENDWNWKIWVPRNIQDRIESFYESHGGKRGWIKYSADNRAPELGAEMSLPILGGGGLLSPSGRFVYCWGNIGRIVHLDGTFSYVAFHN